MNNKTQLAPMENDILWILEESGEENIACVLNTLLAKYCLSSNDVLIQGVAALVTLVEYGYISLHAQGERLLPLKDNIAALAQYHIHHPVRWLDMPAFQENIDLLSSMMVFDQAAGYWRWNRSPIDAPGLSIVMEKSGFEALTR